MNIIRANEQFHSLSEHEVRAVLSHGGNEPVIGELSRLVDGYKIFFEEDCEKSAHMAENSLRLLIEWPIEAVAVALAATGHDKEMEKKEEERILPAALALTGWSAFGQQWQVPLAEELGINDRTMRRWAADGAPTRIVNELLEIVEERVKAGRQVLTMLRAISPS